VDYLYMYFKFRHTSKTVISAQSIVQRQLNNPWNIFRQVIFDVRVPFRCYPNILNLERRYSPFCFIYVSIGGGNVTSSKITDVVWSGVSFATYICPRSFIFFMIQLTLNNRLSTNNGFTSMNMKIIKYSSSKIA
jgi:hypothetical protein